ncbi:MAG TPA: spore photoproduct lyase [Clostridiales bacterium]|nr:MAG: spore photoproduct lyase [Clostridiales bacterium GWD2_32_59]HAN09149.1 spore photoproduct lyase [Clostridiales bacterium]
MFIPKRIFFEKKALEYEIGQRVYDKFKDKDIELIIDNKVHFPSNDNPVEKYKEGKQTLVVGVKRVSKFETCKPSADYQLPLISGCTGRCEYCYLNTKLGDKPYTKVFVNVDDILNNAKKYISKNDNITVFEGAATSDPIPVEPYTNILEKTINFFAKEKNGLFRFVTKYTDVDTLLNLNHNNHTTIRFSMNTDKIISEYEHSTPSMSRRIEASQKIMNAGYPSGFIIAPVFLYDGWKKDYSELIDKLSTLVPKDYKHDILFEVISHRYTITAKNIILNIFPNTTLPMNEDERKFKYGQFGYGKYVYTKEQLSDMKDFFTQKISSLFSKENIVYII